MALACGVFVTVGRVFFVTKLGAADTQEKEAWMRDAEKVRRPEAESWRRGVAS